MRRKVQGFTLVELLVVITIIGILMSLVLPATQAVRSAAQRTKCKNNLRQLGIACRAHEAQHGYFPSGGWGWGWTGDPDLGFGSRQCGGWLYSVLPYIEEDALWALGKDESSSAKRSANAERVATPLAVINCPSRRQAITFPAFDTPMETDRVLAVARSCYAINCGDQQTNEFFAGPSSIEEGRKKSFDGWHDTSKLTGVSYERSQVGSARIHDGMSSTYLIGEKSVMPEQYLAGGPPSEDQTAYSGFCNDNYRTASEAPHRDLNGINRPRAFGSPHSNGVHFVFCDGSVHVVSYAIRPKVHKALANRDDGTKLEEEFFRAR